MASSRKKGLIIMIILGVVGIFGYSQYVFASQIDVNITQSELLDVDENGSNYSIQLQFENPSLLILTAGETEFFVNANNQMIGKGQLESFTLQPLASSYVEGTFHMNSDASQESYSIAISGITKYDLLFTSIDVPFVYYPTKEQAIAFIHQN